MSLQTVLRTRSVYFSCWSVARQHFSLFYLPGLLTESVTTTNKRGVLRKTPVVDKCFTTHHETKLFFCLGDLKKKVVLVSQPLVFGCLKRNPNISYRSWIVCQQTIVFQPTNLSIYPEAERPQRRAL